MIKIIHQRKLIEGTIHKITQFYLELNIKAKIGI